jgi:pimeloyl-ACP methyl ester carboxylesterase
MKKIILFFCGWMITSVLLSQKCDPSKTPIVFVHGFLGSGDTYATQFQRFISNGYCNDQLHVFDWNSIGARGNTNAQLDSFINVVIKKTGADKINLVGHSAGGGIGYSYLNDSLRAMKVAHYVHIGSGKNTKPAGKRGEVPTMNIFSTDDKVAKGGEIPGATNVKQSQNDHYQVATSETSFYSMFSFFNNGSNASVKNKKERKPLIAGKACLMGENTALAGASIDVYAFDLKKGNRKKSAPDFHFLADSLGNWGPFIADPSTGYEFVLQPKGGQRTVNYFHEPFVQSNSLVYLRALPKTGMTALLLNILPSDDQQSVLAIFTSNGAVVNGRDSLTINDINLSSSIISPASKTGIAQFIFDDGDKKSSGNLIPNFNAVPFMNGVDILLDTKSNSPIHLYFNGRDLYLPKRKSASEGVMVLVLN